MFAVDNPFETEEKTLSTDDEDDCQIPAEYKRIAGRTPVDVIEYLGIHRAKPLGVNQHSPAEWE
jgi:hypothetical protein